MKSKTPTWLWAVPVFSCGLLAVAPPFALALKSRARRDWSWTVAVAALSFVGFALVGSGDPESTSATDSVGVLLMVASMIVGAVYASVRWPETSALSDHAVQPFAAPQPFTAAQGNAAAVARVEAVRRRRAEAREIVAKDPLMARELRIGRPDVPRNYDDGGLVAVNSAPANVFVHEFGWSVAVAEGVVSARTTVGRFQSLDDLVLLAGVAQHEYDVVRDRLLLL